MATVSRAAMLREETGEPQELENFQCIQPTLVIRATIDLLRKAQLRAIYHFGLSNSRPYLVLRRSTPCSVVCSSRRIIQSRCDSRHSRSAVAWLLNLGLCSDRVACVACHLMGPPHFCRWKSASPANHFPRTRIRRGMPFEMLGANAILTGTRNRI